MSYRMVPSVGSNLNIKEYFQVIFLFLLRNKMINRFEKRFSKRIGLKFVYSTWSGRLALYLALLVLKNIKSDQTEVLLSSLTCESVYYAIKWAGLIPVLYDIDIETFGPNIDHIYAKINENTLCVIVSSLYGYVFNMDKILRLKEQKKKFLIEDVAQSLEAKWKNNKFGTFGDISFFSFGKSKNMSTVLGGIIGTNSNKLDKQIKKVYMNFRKPGLLENTKIFLLFTASFIFLKPFILKIVSLLKKSFVTHDHHINYPLTRMGCLQKAIGYLMLNKIDKLTQIRILNAHSLKQVLNGSKYLQLIPDIREGYSVYLRFPVYMNNKDTLINYLNQLRKNGIWVVENIFDPLYILANDSSNNYPNTAFVHEKILILPTHPYLNQKDIKKIKAILNP